MQLIAVEPPRLRDEPIHQSRAVAATAAIADPDERERIREIMVVLFGELGPEHPLTTLYRRRLATALY